MSLNSTRFWMALAIAAPALLETTPAWAQYGLGVREDDGASNASRNQLPPDLAAVSVTEHLNSQLPMDVVLRDEQGHERQLREFFDGRHPVLINMAYYRCPMLCNLVSNAVINGLRGVAWTVGEEFEILTVSIDPRETSADALARRARVSDQYGRAGGSHGWHFTVGDEAQVRRLANALGFGYRFERASNQYAHPAVVFLATPNGKVARYLYGISFNPADLRMGLLEASEGRSISTVERVLLYCYHYDPRDRRYALVAKQVMKLGGVLTIILLGGGLFALWAREVRRARKSDNDDSTPREDVQTAA